MGEKMAAKVGMPRHPWQTYEQIIDADLVPPPAFLREGRLPDLGTDPVAVERYFSQEFFEKEARYLWPHVWQFACREEDIPNVGDYQIYEILGKSLIVTRSSSNETKAFYNSCLHRGRKLVTLPGSKSEFRCPFHGMAWHCDGRFKDNPIGWDFPQWPKGPALPEAKVDSWGGFIFVNFDPDARPLIDFIAPLASDFSEYGFADKYRIAWVQKKIRANWKVTAEAFMESHHSVTTHPQILPGIGDGNSQYDLPNDWISRHFSASAVASPFIDPRSEQQILDHMLKNSGRARALREGADTRLAEGKTARAFLAENARHALHEITGKSYDRASDAEMLDSLLYNIFPHMSFWAGYGANIVYRWRPNGRDPETSIMDVMLLAPCPKDASRPKPAPVRILELDDPWTDAPELGGLIPIFEQDMGNLPHIQEGLHASGTGTVNFSSYSEMRIRQLHRMIDRYIELEGKALP